MNGREILAVTAINILLLLFSRGVAGAEMKVAGESRSPAASASPNGDFSLESRMIVSSKLLPFGAISAHYTEKNGDCKKGGNSSSSRPKHPFNATTNSPTSSTKETIIHAKVQLPPAKIQSSSSSSAPPSSSGLRSSFSSSTSSSAEIFYSANDSNSNVSNSRNNGYLKSLKSLVKNNRHKVVKRSCLINSALAALRHTPDKPQKMVLVITGRVEDVMVLHSNNNNNNEHLRRKSGYGENHDDNNKERRKQSDGVASSTTTYTSSEARSSIIGTANNDGDDDDAILSMSDSDNDEYEFVHRGYHPATTTPIHAATRAPRLRPDQIFTKTDDATSSSTFPSVATSQISATNNGFSNIINRNGMRTLGNTSLLHSLFGESYMNLQGATSGVTASPASILPPSDNHLEGNNSKTGRRRKRQHERHVQLLSEDSFANFETKMKELNIFAAERVDGNNDEIEVTNSGQTFASVNVHYSNHNDYGNFRIGNHSSSIQKVFSTNDDDDNISRKSFPSRQLPKLPKKETSPGTAWQQKEGFSSTRSNTETVLQSVAKITKEFLHGKGRSSEMRYAVLVRVKRVIKGDRALENTAIIIDGFGYHHQRFCAPPRVSVRDTRIFILDVDKDKRITLAAHPLPVTLKNLRRIDESSKEMRKPKGKSALKELLTEVKKEK